MENEEKITEKQLLQKMQKLTKTAKTDVSYKYDGILFFTEHLHKIGINAFEVLQKAYNDATRNG